MKSDEGIMAQVAVQPEKDRGWRGRFFAEQSQDGVFLPIYANEPVFYTVPTHVDFPRWRVNVYETEKLGSDAKVYMKIKNLTGIEPRSVFPQRPAGSLLFDSDNPSLETSRK